MSDLERAYIEWRKTRLNETGDAWEAFQAGAALRSPRPSPADLRKKVARMLSENQLSFKYIGRWEDWDATIWADFYGVADKILALLAAPVSPDGAQYWRVVQGGRLKPRGHEIEAKEEEGGSNARGD